MQGYRKEHAGFGHGAPRRADLRNAPRTSFCVNQAPDQRFFAESFEKRACLVP
jgi:hypothetical protein